MGGWKRFDKLVAILARLETETRHNWDAAISRVVYTHGSKNRPNTINDSTASMLSERMVTSAKRSYDRNPDGTSE